MAVNNRQIAENILAAVGGRENITSVTHCMTRLRFNLKDMGLPDQEQIKKQREQLQDFRKKFSALCSRGDDLFGSL